MNTIRDVARVAGVSVSTVSRVLNEPLVVTSAKRERVYKAISELDFRPNRTAQSLKSKSFKTIAMVVTDISNIFFAEIASSIEGYCDAAGYGLLLCSLNNREDRLERFLEELPQRGVDGLIICGGAYLESDRIYPLLQNLITRRLPLVFSGHQVEGLNVPTVTNDSASGIGQIVEHLWNQGRRRLAYLGGPTHSAIARERLASFREQASARGFEIRERLVQEVDYDFDSGRRASKALLAVDPALDALICGGDQIAVGAIRGLKEMGKFIPRDIAVVGFDDTQLARFSEPRLTSVSVNVDQIGSNATQKLIDVIDGKPIEMFTQIACELIVRESA